MLVRQSNISVALAVKTVPLWHKVQSRLSCQLPVTTNSRCFVLSPSLLSPMLHASARGVLPIVSPPTICSWQAQYMRTVLPITPLLELSVPHGFISTNWGMSTRVRTSRKVPKKRIRPMLCNRQKWSKHFFLFACQIPGLWSCYLVTHISPPPLPLHLLSPPLLG